MPDLDELAANASDDFKAANPQIFGVSPTTRTAQDGVVAALAAAKGASASDSMVGIKSGASWRGFESEVIGWLRDNGWRVAHFRAGLTRSGRWVTPVSADGVGFPDTLAVKGRVCITLEIKTGAGKASPAQVEWMLSLDRAGIRAFLVTPENWEEVKQKIVAL